MGFQQLYTERQVVNIIEQIGSKDMNYWLKAVDSVFLGIAPEIEILKAPITVAFTNQFLGEAESWGGVVNNDYSYDLIEGKNYVVKVMVGKISGETQELELSAVATVDSGASKPPSLGFVVEDNLHFTLEDKVHFKFTEPYYTEGEDFSLVSATDTSSKPYTWSYIIVSSLIQKEADTNLLKEPLNSVVDTESPIAIGYKLGLGVGKAYDVEFAIDGVIHTVTNFAMSMAELDEGFPASSALLGAFVVPDTSKDEREATRGQFYVYDGINAEMQEAENSVYVFVCQDSEDNAVTAQVLSIKENTSDFEEFATPIELNFDNSNTIWTPGGDWCNGFNFKKSEFLKSIKDGDIVRLTADMSITHNGEVLSFTDVKFDETATVDSEGLGIKFYLWHDTDDVFPDLHITDVNGRPSDYVFVGVELGTTNFVCKIKSMEIAPAGGLLQSDVVLNSDKTSQNLGYNLGLKAGNNYDVDFYVTNSSGGKVTYNKTVLATDGTSTAGGGVLLSMVQDSINFMIADGLSISDAGNPVVDANNAVIAATQFGDFVSITVTKIVYNSK